MQQPAMYTAVHLLTHPLSPFFLLANSFFGIVSYMNRLWCVWELYTLFAVSDRDPSLIVRDFAASGEVPLKERLATFTLGDHSDCYDPNERRKLLQAIRAAPGGEQAFNGIIQGLADTVNVKVVNSQKLGSRLSMAFRGSIRRATGSRASTQSSASTNSKSSHLSIPNTIPSSSNVDLPQPAHLPPINGAGGASH